MPTMTEASDQLVVTSSNILECLEMAPEKFGLWLIAGFVAMIMVIVIVSETTKMQCRVGLAQAGRSTADITEICK